MSVCMSQLVFHAVWIMALLIGLWLARVTLPPSWPDTEPTDPFDPEAPNTGAFPVPEETHK